MQTDNAKGSSQLLGLLLLETSSPKPFLKLDVYNKQNIVKFLVVNDKFLLNVHAYTAL